MSKTNTSSKFYFFDKAIEHIETGLFRFVSTIKFVSKFKRHKIYKSSHKLIVIHLNACTIRIYAPTYKHTCTYIHTCMNVCMSVCIYAGMYACKYVCMYICMYICMYVSRYVCMYVCK